MNLRTSPGKRGQCVHDWQQIFSKSKGRPLADILGRASKFCLREKLNGHKSVLNVAESLGVRIGELIANLLRKGNAVESMRQYDLHRCVEYSMQTHLHSTSSS